jgi:hypothetical protein
MPKTARGFDRTPGIWRLKMKISKVIIIGMLGILVLAACGGGNGGEEPTDVVAKVVDAMETLDIDGASEHFCAEQKEGLSDTMAEGFAELETMGLNPDELLDAFKLNFADVEYEEKSQEGDEAVVHVTGTMSLAFDTEKLKEFFKKAAEAAGQEVSDQELEFVVGIFDTMSGQEAPLDGDVKLVKEDGEWVVCDELSFLEAGDIFELPLP